MPEAVGHASAADGRRGVFRRGEGLDDGRQIGVVPLDGGLLSPPASLSRRRLDCRRLR
jgi:hypothetical protein